MLAACSGRPSVACSSLVGRPLLGLRSPLCGRYLADQRPRRLLVIQALADPWKTLGVGQNASEKEIKRAHRKLVLQCHPDLSKEDPNAEARFLQVQEAYEIIMGRRRGKELDVSANGTSWEFHDWYWRFSMSKRWGRGKKTGAGNPFASATPPPGSQWKSQLDGLKRKAAAKRGKQRPSAERPPSQGASAAGQQPSWARRHTYAAEQQGGTTTAATTAAAQSAPGVRQAQDRTQQGQRQERARPSAAKAAQPEQRQHKEEPAQQRAAVEGTEQALDGMQTGSEPGRDTSGQEPLLGWATAFAEGSHQLKETEEHPLHHQPPLSHHTQHAPAPTPQPPQPAHAEQSHHDRRPQHQQGQEHGLPLSDLMGRVVGSVHRLGSEPGVTLQNHIVRLVRRASQLSQHLQVQLVKLRSLSLAKEGGAAHAEHSAQHAQHAELHVEFEETVRLWQQGQQRQQGGAGAHSDEHSAATSMAQHAQQGAAEAEGVQQDRGMSAEEYARRSKRFVNDGQVRERVSSQLAGLKRRATLRQEFCE